MPDDAARLTARTRVDNTGLTRGMQEADRVVRDGARKMQQTASANPLTMTVDELRLRNEMLQAEATVRERMHSIDRAVRSSSMLIGDGMGSAISTAISPHLARLRHDQELLQRTASSVGGGLGGGLGGGIAFAGIIAGAGVAIKAIAGVTEELYSAGAAAQRLQSGFADMVGGSDKAVAMLGKLRDASQGTISDMDLIASANRAMMLEVTDDADTMARLLEVAIARGRNLGISAQQAFNDIATGIGRRSALILDNLGILTGGQRGLEAYAESIGKTTAELTEFEERQYLVNKVLEDSVTLTDDAASGVERYQSAWANLKTEMGIVAVGALPDVPGAAAGAVGEMADQMRRHREAADAMRAYMDQLIALEQAGEVTGAQLGAMTQRWMLLSVEVDKGRMTHEQAAIVMLGYFPELRSALEDLTQAQIEATAQTELASGAALRKEQADMRAAGAARERAAAERGLANAIAAGYGAQLDPWLVRRLHDPNAGRGESIQDQIRNDEQALREYQNSLKVTGGGGISDAQRLAEQRAREFQALVQSVLQPTQVTGADVSATEHGAYRDKWDEEMRRLRAREDIPYYQRAETERQFYSGQLPEMVNWDAMIEDIARRQQEEVGKQNLLDEAMRRAQEAGLGANYAAVAAALGIKDDTATGIDAAAAFDQGAKSINVAANVTEQFVESMKAERVAWVEAGAEAMRAFLEGSDEAVTPDAGKKFARRIVPFIYDEMTAQGML